MSAKDEPEPVDVDAQDLLRALLAITPEDAAEVREVSDEKADSSPVVKAIK